MWELLQQLKDSGFPQYGEGDYFSNPLCPDKDKPHDTSKCELYVPSVEEAINACGDRFGALVRMPDGKWSAASPVMDTGMSMGAAHEFVHDNMRAAVIGLYISISNRK